MAERVRRSDVKPFSYRTGYEEVLECGPEDLFATTLVGDDHDWEWSSSATPLPTPGTEVLVELKGRTLPVIWVNRDMGVIDGGDAEEPASQRRPASA
jgi:hypothetical protein